jgi:hypothetical protein
VAESGIAWSWTGAEGFKQSQILTGRRRAPSAILRAQGDALKHGVLRAQSEAEAIHKVFL